MALYYSCCLISKLRDAKDGGGRIGIILNGSPLFWRRGFRVNQKFAVARSRLLRNRCRICRPICSTTPVLRTYVWVLSNKKRPRKGQVQMINGANLCGKMRKSLGSKRNEMSNDDIATITSAGNFEVVDARELDKPTPSQE